MVECYCNRIKVGDDYDFTQIVESCADYVL